MKLKSTLLALFVLSLLALRAQVVDFEESPVGGTSFTAGGFEFSMTGDLTISSFEDFSCDGSAGANQYMDTGYLDGASEGVLGSFAPVNTEVTFQVDVTASQCAWPGSGDGEFISSGTIRFTGQTADGGTVSEDFTLTSLNFTELLPFSFSAAIWEDIDLKSMELELVATTDSTDYWAIDNLSLTEIGVVSSVEEVGVEPISVYPNPVTDEVRIIAPPQSRISIYDHTGQQLRAMLSAGQSIDMSDFPGGLYTFVVQVDGELSSVRVIKQ